MISAKQLICWHEYKIIYTHKHQFKNIYVCEYCGLYLLNEWYLESKTKSSLLEDLIGESLDSWKVVGK